MTAHDIVAGKQYHLMSGKRGVGLEVEVNWDWVRQSNEEDGLWQSVIFHEYEGGRYVIEHTSFHWDGYKYWQMSGGGVCLNQWDPSTAWTVHPTKNGFVLSKGDNFLRRASGGGKRWLKGVHSSSLASKLTMGLSDIGNMAADAGEGNKIVEFQAIPV